MRITLVLAALAWLGTRPAAQAQAAGPALLQQAAQQEAAGRLEAAATTYAKAAAFRAAGDSPAAAAAYGKSASASERYADQLLAGPRVLPAAGPAAPAGRWGCFSSWTCSTTSASTTSRRPGRCT